MKRWFWIRNLPLLLSLGLLVGCAQSAPAVTSSPTADGTTAYATANAPTKAPEPEAEPTIVNFWTTDNEPSRLSAYEAVAQRYMAQHPQVEVRITGVDEATVADEIVAAAADGRAPDLVRIGLERTATLISNNLLDFAAAEATVESVGRDDFRAAPLAMTSLPSTGEIFAIPYDGWAQALWYRQDLFTDAGLNAPISWDDINAACDQLAATGQLEIGLSLPSDPKSNYTHQVFEQVAMSNNAWPFDSAGNVTMNSLQMIEALRFYTDLQRCSPPAPQDLFNAREAYATGDAGMLFYSTYIMDDLLEGSTRRDGSAFEVAVDDLAGKTGFAAGMIGPNGTATYGQLVTLALISGADPAAQDVARFFLTDGYYDILKTAPLGKIPVLKSALRDWTALSPVFSYYSDATLGYIADSYEHMERWIFQPEYDVAQRLVIGEIENKLLIPQAIQLILEEGMTPAQAAAWLQAEVEALVAQNAAQG